MKKEEVFNQGVLSNLSNLSDSQNASQSADNQQEVVNADGYLTCHIDTDRLPQMLQKILTISDNNSVRDMLFLSSITALSYACPKFWTLHGKPSKRYNANLMTMILAPAASGKGVMSYTKQLLRPIHEELNKESKTGKKQMVFIPCNSTASAFIQQLADNDGKGLLFANEMDTLSQMWKSSYGKFSDVLRCAFEHESIGMRRRTNNEYIEIDNPQLSVLVSGTYNQLLPLIRSRENGLASRFACYVVKDIQKFDSNVFDEESLSAGSEAENLFRQLGTSVKIFYDWQMRQTGSCQFCFTRSQSEKLARMVQGQWGAYVTEDNRDFDSTIKRIGVVIKRIGIVLGALRTSMTEPLPEKIYCSDDDFQVLTVVMNKMLLHAAWMFELLPPAQAKIYSRSVNYQQQQYWQSLPTDFTRTDAMQLADDYGINQVTATRWINQRVEAGEAIRVSQGHYKKGA
ncbi:MAG: DUF3987 domain-containing protein [Prevotellaceae bacterium]|nr:DUF3987 domain-containing protein [Candidatus Colivivens equi]